MEVALSHFSNTVTAAAERVLSSHIDVRSETRQVPDVQDIAFDKNEGVVIDGCYVYADMRDSSILGQRVKKPVSAKIIRSYINGSAAILRHHGGEIRSFDGDRVMAIFIGPSKETNAVQAAFGVNWFLDQFLRDRIHAYWQDLKTDQIFTLAHCIGIDTGEALITRTGVRGDNDLISIGAAPNVAAKLSDLKSGYPINITSEVFDQMDDSCATFSDTGMRIWNKIYPSPVIGGTTRQVLGGNAVSEP